MMTAGTPVQNTRKRESITFDGDMFREASTATYVEHETGGYTVSLHLHRREEFLFWAYRGKKRAKTAYKLLCDVARKLANGASREKILEVLEGV